MFDRPSEIVRLVVLGLGLVPAVAVAQQDPAPPAEPAAPQAAPAQDAGAVAPDPGQPLPGPPEVPEVQLGPVLETTPVRRGSLGPNATLVRAEVLPRDRQGIWVLDFAYKPVRLVTVEVPGKGRRQLFYLYYQVVNNTGEPRMFVPQFTLVTNTGRRYEDAVIPQAVQVVQGREDQTTPLHGAVDIVGVLPLSGDKEGIDDAVYGVAVWEGVDPAVNRFSIFVRGLSDGYQLVTPPEESEPQVRYKTLRLDFIRYGDEFIIREQDIRPAEPPFDWTYW